MSAVLDELAPGYIGEDRIKVSLSTDSQNPSAFSPVTLDVDYSACSPEGIVLPLEMIVQGPSKSSFRRVYHTRISPSTLTFKPREGGLHVVILREVAHNRWFGTVKFQVAGEQLYGGNE